MNKHTPVLIDESINSLEITSKGIYIDATLGGGGYSQKILELNEECLVISFEIDQNTVTSYLNNIGKSNIEAEEGISKLNSNHIVVNKNFSELSEVLSSLKISKVDGIVADLGWSSNQLETIEGLSFERGQDELDMRFNPDLGVKASDLLNALGRKELNSIFIKYGDFNKGEAIKFSQNIIKRRESNKFKTVSDLVEVTENTFRRFNSRAGRNLMQTKARVFQVLRVVVNSEYENLHELLRKGFEHLKETGVLSIVTFHSGEEKTVEEFINLNKSFLSFTQKVPTTEEITKNERARSAKLWIIKKMSRNNQKKKPIFKKFNKRLAIAVLLLVVVFFGSQIYITSVIGTSNAAIEEIRREKDQLRLSNEIISSEIDELKSIKNLQAVAEKYGLTEKQVSEISTVESIALEY